MDYQSSYKINTFSASAKSEVERLEAQVNLFWEKELAIYKLNGLADGMAIVECGCGSGLVGRKILDAYPQSTITGFDIDPYLVETAKTNANRWNLDNYEVSNRSILDTKLSENTYDFAIARLVLEHLSNPIDAIVEVFRILKPGGKAVFIDNDFEFHLITFPPIAELSDLYGAYCKARSDDGGNPKIGRELPSLLKYANFSEVNLEILCAHNGIIGDEIFLKSEGSGIPAKLVKDGYLSGTSYTQIARKWNELIRTKWHSIYRQLFLCVGTKPMSFATEKRPTSEYGAPADGVASQRNIAALPEIPDDVDSETAGKSTSDYPGVQNIVSGVWAKVIESDSIALNDNFFEAGGSSLHALEIVELLEEQFKLALSVIDLFENPTISLFASYVHDKLGGSEQTNEKDRKAARREKIAERRARMKKLNRQ